MLRKDTHHSLKSEGVYLVAFRKVLLCRKVLEIFWDVKATDKLAPERDDVIDMMAVWAV